MPIQRAPTMRRKWPWAKIRRVAVGREPALDDAVRARSDLRQRLAVGDLVAPDVQPGIVLRTSFVVTPS